MSGADQKKKLNKVVLFMIITGVIMLGTLVWGWIFPEEQVKVIQSSDLIAESETSNTTTIELIPVYLVGAVVRPGIYQIERGSYLYQVIEKAGGLLDTAASESINLALRLDDNQRIRIPTREEVAEDPNSAALMINQSAASPLINLNLADQALLDTLPGVGPSTAKAIIEYRKKNGSFRTIEDLMKVPGIKESRYNALKDLIYCQ